MALERLSGAEFCSWAPLRWGTLESEVSQPLVALDLCYALTLAHPNPGLSVNELEDPGAIAYSVWLEDACIYLWRVGDCVEVVLLDPNCKWVMPLYWRCGGKALTPLCMFWCCRGYAVLVAMFVDFRWASLVSQLDIDDILGVSWPLTSCLASGTSYGHFRL